MFVIFCNMREMCEIHFRRSASSFFATLKCNAIKEKKRKLESYNIGQGHCSMPKENSSQKGGFMFQQTADYVLRETCQYIDLSRMKNLLAIK